MGNKAIIDTNVLVSSLISKGRRTAVTDFMDKVFAKEIKPVASEDIFKEYRKVLSRPKFGFPKEVMLRHEK